MILEGGSRGLLSKNIKKWAVERSRAGGIHGAFWLSRQCIVVWLFRQDNCREHALSCVIRGENWSKWIANYLI